jgi:alpha-L-rhamnosidase
MLASTSPHAQTLALMAGLAPASAPVRERFLLDYLRDETGHTSKPSAYWITYVYAVLAGRGHGAEVVAHLRPRWEPMIAYGSTFELFRDHPEFQISHSHAWSAHPLFHLMQIIGGVRQAAAQWRRIDYAPVFVGDSGGCTVPTPLGPITSAWRRKGPDVQVELTLPRAMTATVRLPGQSPVKATGRKTWKIASASAD